MKQLYANNAKTLLASAIGPTGVGSLQLTVGSGSKFPSPSSNEYFLVTLESGSLIEVFTITSRSGDILTIGLRGQEGTVASSFPIGTRVECRVTAGTLGRLSTTFYPLAGVDVVVRPGLAYNKGYICGTYDPFGNPVILISKDDSTWSSVNFTSIISGAVVSGTTTTMTSFTGVTTTSEVLPGKFLIQFTSGALLGQVRAVTANNGTTITWYEAVASAPVAGTTFEILESNACLLTDSVDNSEDAIALAITLG